MVGVGFAAGVRGVLKGCATPGLEVAAGAPDSERGVAVVVVSAVTGVDAREEVVAKERALEARARAGVRRESVERQRLQIIVTVCCGSCGSVRRGAFGIARQWVGSSRCRFPKTEGLRRRRSEEGRNVGGSSLAARDTELHPLAIRRK